MTAQFGETLPLRYETDRRFTHRFALAVVVVTITRSAFVFVAAAFVAVGLMGLLGVLAGLLLSVSTGEWHDSTPMLIALLISVAFLAMMIGLGYYSARLTLDRQFPIGSVLAAGLGEQKLALTIPGSTGEIDYRNYRKVTRVRDFISLASSVGLRRTLLPAELFPGDALDELKAKIAHARTLP